MPVKDRGMPKVRYALYPGAVKAIRALSEAKLDTSL